MENEKDIQQNEELVKQLEAYMYKRNFKKYQLANFLGTTEGNVSRWLKRKHIIGSAWQQLIKIKLDLKD